MISKPVLKVLVNRYLRDAKVLKDNRRYTSAVYLAGYAIELALKYRICRLMILGQGFPENRREFDNYYSNAKRRLLRNTIKELRDIRNHDLERLLQYSGEKYNVLSGLVNDWNLISTWNPEIRYKNSTIKKGGCDAFLTSAIRIVNVLI